MTIQEKLIKLSTNIFDSENDCGFAIIRHDGNYITIFIDYLNPSLLARIDQDGFIIKNVSVHNIKKRLVISIEPK